MPVTSWSSQAIMAMRLDLAVRFQYQPEPEELAATSL
jgi:hypothetical protein